ncbi:serine-rich adhesin for platelets-like isoform X2 [Anastrepha obliqua]|uniref:serine-rich adhesin for platelets-like isoform X2 n=1 Tax=Anastrepha obliqua TaxID=95512 RepID=UPI002408F7E8|nr:serine-rich adhesin for platelets-like isoform X2 [Anastrepha obliqua]
MTHDSLQAQATALNSRTPVNYENSTLTMASTTPATSLGVAALPRKNSDSHIARLKAQKNQSNLFLIKSYSFIDKSLKNHALPQKSKSTLDNLSSLRQTGALLLDDTHTGKAFENAKAANNKKKTKSKQSNDSVADLRPLLRHPSVIAEGVVSETPVRPKSLPIPAAAHSHTQPDSVAPPLRHNKSDKCVPNVFKRESFLRHSLQSIRRSFRAHTKFTGFGHHATNSNASTTSTTSACSKASKTSSAASSSSKFSASSSTTSSTSATSADAADVLRHSNCNGEICSKRGKVGITIRLNGKAANRTEEEDEFGDCTSEDFGAKRRLHLADDGVACCQSVSTFAATPNDSTSMAPLQSHAETQSVTTLNLHEKDVSPIGSNSSGTQLSRKQLRHQRNNSNQSDYYTAAHLATTSDSSTQNLSNCRGEGRSLNPLAPSESRTSIRSISPTSRKSATSSNWSGHTTAKHEQSTAAATAAAAASTMPVEKEKKRKEVSSSRVKKFHRHFTQVSKDEKLINYFSCALVSDILLQGHLYITDQHFAFYSNVFGYVTKVVIPTSSVTKISKEKTAKIIPNAVGVATADERHVFGSFISREAAFRLMCSVCPPLAPAEILPKIPAEIEVSEEYSIEDDSSCSISGNESPPQALAAVAAAAAGSMNELGQTLIRRNLAGSSHSIAEGKTTAHENHRHSDIPVDAKQAGAFSNSNSAPSTASHNSNSDKSATCVGTNANCNDGIVTTGIALIVAGTASSTTSASSSPTPSTSSSLPTTVMAGTPRSAAHAAVSSFKTLRQKALLRLKFPTELHVVYLGVLLTMVLALFSVFLLYRILDIEAKTSTHTPTEFNWRSGNDDDIFAEALRWQKELQAKSTEEAQNILTHNLEQIAKVRRSLETLSMLIHDRSSAYANRDDSD